MITWKVVVILVLLAGTAAAVTTGEFGRYQVILDRKPFGEPPPPPPVAPPPPAKPEEPPEFTKTLTLCAIVDGDMGLRVGLVKKGKTPQVYYLRPGEVEDGIELLEADYEGQRALLRVEGEEHWLGMTAESTITSTAPPAPPKGAKPKKPSVAKKGSAASRRPTVSTRKTKSGSYAERLRTRREEAQRRLAELQAKAKANATAKGEGSKEDPFSPLGEELKKHLEEYQMELIRKGMPPLPMALTPEMDEKLVEEGILPPQPAEEE